MMNKLLGIIITSILLTGCKKDEGDLIFDYSFGTDSEGWIMGYSDYPANLSPDDSLNLYEMSFGHSPLPENIIPPQSGIRIRGHNRSDDLFMFIKKKITGLPAGTDYSITFRIELASNVPTNAVGIGGPPGEAVTIKAGAVSFEPQNIIDDGGWYRLNIDKGNQSAGGDDVTILGNVGVADNTTEYTLITRRSQSSLQAKTNNNGDIWVIIGTDSGFEGLTELYYSSVSITFKR
jgi:hypothetical protein